MHVVILVGKRVSSTMDDKQKFPGVMTSVCINGEALVLGQLGGNSCEERGMELRSIFCSREESRGMSLFSSLVAIWFSWSFLAEASFFSRS